MTQSRKRESSPEYYGTGANFPSEVVSLEGCTISITDNKWAGREGVATLSLNFDLIHGLISPRLLDSLKAALLWYVQNLSLNTVAAAYGAFRSLLYALRENGQSEVLEEITAEHVLRYRALLMADGKEWFLGHLSPFLRKWFKLGYPGVDGAAKVFQELTIAGSPKGVAVTTMDPMQGPYTELERQAIETGLRATFGRGEITEEAFLLAWLFIALGARPVQVAALKVCDLIRDEDEKGNITYHVRMPRAKQRYQAHRTKFKMRPLVDHIGAPLWDYAGRVRQEFANILSDAGNAPLFPQRTPADWARGFEYHKSAEALSQMFKKEMRSLRVMSERTGDLVNITPRRFRRSLGTRAAQEGYGELVIAEILDHSDTQSVGVYVGVVPEIVKRIDHAVAMELAPLAQAFSGRLIADESQATRRGDHSSRIVDLRIDMQGRPMGSCGEHSFCHFNAPIACYTCDRFEPWLDGPHEAVLQHLLSARGKSLELSDRRIASVNDRTIVAVAQVIQMCEMTRSHHMRVSNG